MINEKILIVIFIALALLGIADLINSNKISNKRKKLKKNDLINTD